jgi:[calcium/calmodulin-dependent protein kinase] kinase
MSNTVGSNYFFSPEICKGIEHTGKPSDVWALGVTLYYMLFTEYPFTAKANDYKNLYDKIMNEEPNYPDYDDKDAIDLLKKIFIKDPEKRITLRDIREHDWVTVTGKFPLVEEYEDLSDSED